MSVQQIVRYQGSLCLLNQHTVPHAMHKPDCKYVVSINAASFGLQTEQQPCPKGQNREHIICNIYSLQKTISYKAIEINYI